MLLTLVCWWTSAPFLLALIKEELSALRITCFEDSKVIQKEISYSNDNLNMGKSHYSNKRKKGKTVEYIKCQLLQKGYIHP